MRLNTAVFDDLVQTASFSADLAALRAIKRGVTPAQQMQEAVEAGLAAAIGLGMVEVTLASSWPELRRTDWVKADVIVLEDSDD